MLDTGAMYRAVTLAALERGVALDDDAVACEAAAVDAEIVVDGTVRLDGRDVSAEIRGPEVTAAVSTVSAHPGCARCSSARQRDWVDEHGGGVVEGRDIGTVVFPDAPVKVFLTATDEARAARRQHDEADAARGTTVDEVAADLARRDALDSIGLRRRSSPPPTRSSSTHDQRRARRDRRDRGPGRSGLRDRGRCRLMFYKFGRSVIVALGLRASSASRSGAVTGFRRARSSSRRRTGRSSTSRFAAT